MRVDGRDASGSGGLVDPKQVLRRDYAGQRPDFSEFRSVGC
jgi:hypothetical protein